MWLIKTDSAGNEEWNKITEGYVSGAGYSSHQTISGGYVITGWASTPEEGTNVCLTRLAAEDNEIIESPTSSPTEFVLCEVYPNPFNSTTTLSVSLPVSSDLKLSVYNIVGQEVTVLTNGNYSEGYHQFTFNADGLSSGIYFIQATVPRKMSELRKVVLLR